MWLIKTWRFGMFRIALLLLLCLFSGGAFAQSVGTFTCNECALTSPVPDGDTLIFIRTEVNQKVATWWNSSTQTGKRVTICNTSKCVVYQYQANGNFLLIAEAPIGGGGGGSGGDPGGSTGGGGGGYIGGGGCFGSCGSGGGTVTVGPIELPEKQDT